jgi:hypothetical protein
MLMLSVVGVLLILKPVIGHHPCATWSSGKHIELEGLVCVEQSLWPSGHSSVLGSGLTAERKFTLPRKPQKR